MTPALALLTPRGLAREPDDRLLELVRAGSDAAFCVIHQRYCGRLRGYVRRLLGSHADEADDVIQDVFIRAHRSMRACDRALALESWLHTIARNRAIDHLRRPGSRNLELLEDVHGAPAEHDPATRLLERERMQGLVEDINALPERQRRALTLRELNGASYREVASDLQVSIAAMKSLLGRARTNLADADASRWAEPPLAA